MNIMTIDLGTTNIKICLFDPGLDTLAETSKPVVYDRRGDFVEFDPEEYFSSIYQGMLDTGLAGAQHVKEDIVQIVLTGQAESLVLLDGKNRPVCPAISWMDARSQKECKELSAVFDENVCYQTTGQPELIPTWPVTKLLWLRKNRPDAIKKARHILLLKDYIVFRLCGHFVGEHSIYCFSHYFNITQKTYWEDILDYCGVRSAQLPELAPSGTIAGFLHSDLLQPAIGLTGSTKINIGTLDHFAGMIGTGAIRPGIISESAGTVLSLATTTSAPIFDHGMLPNYCGPFPDSYVILPVCESGGFSMEWFKKNFLLDISYSELNQILLQRPASKVPVFLPYLTGVNPPEYNANASGTFFGIQAMHDKYDLSVSVMEGVACLLRKNLEYLEEAGIWVDKIISTGGGARSSFWTQIKANITGREIEIPKNEEAPSFGSAIMAAVGEGYFSSYEDAIRGSVSIARRSVPEPSPYYEETYRLFCKLYSSLEECFARNDSRTVPA